jgi:hypothetical protein
MTLYPIAIAVGYGKCPIFGICPVKSAFALCATTYIRGKGIGADWEH